jgi:threonine synthase
MHYYSTRNKELNDNLYNVILSGLAPDGGLYLPKEFNKLPNEFWENVSKMEFKDILYEVLLNLTDDDDFDKSKLKTELDKCIDFKPLLHSLTENKYILDLNQGPTSAFKDYGANTLSSFMQTIIDENTTKTVLVATSGDTGSAVANAFKDYSKNPKIKVIVLYPKGRVSDDQRLLMTTIGGNIRCLEVDGNFDDCQKLVKMAMSDQEIKSQLTSANSINLIRLYGQVAYYIYANSRLDKNQSQNKKTVFIVPSGNLGNVTAGYISKLIGNKINKFVVAHNANDMFNDLILNGILGDGNKPSIQTISSAMDVSKPSNLERLIVLFGGEFDKYGQCIKLPDIEAMQEIFYVQGFSDENTKQMLSKINSDYDFESDPHTAVAFLGLEHAINGEHPEFADYNQIILSTAHASKFGDVFEQVTGKQANASKPIIEARGKKEIFESIPASYPSLKSYILTV